MPPAVLLAGGRVAEVVLTAQLICDVGRGRIVGHRSVNFGRARRPFDHRDASATLNRRPVLDESLERLFAHGLLARARVADARGACRRETPVTCLLPDGTMLEGVVDLAFEEAGAWTVVDYKTDREILADGEARYRRQVALYASAIAQATAEAALDRARAVTRDAPAPCPS